MGNKSFPPETMQRLAKIIIASWNLSTKKILIWEELTSGHAFTLFFWWEDFGVAQTSTTDILDTKA